MGMLEIITLFVLLVLAAVALYLWRLGRRATASRNVSTTKESFQNSARFAPTLTGDTRSPGMPPPVNSKVDRFLFLERYLPEKRQGVE